MNFKKSDIKELDILTFKNGKSITYYNTDSWILNKYYDDELCCIKDSDYDITSINRAYYCNISDVNEYVHTMNRHDLEVEYVKLYKKVDFLKADINKKNEIIEIYNRFLADIDELSVEDVKKKVRK